jgi:hypothetical protein
LVAELEELDLARIRDSGSGQIRIECEDLHFQQSIRQSFDIGAIFFKSEIGAIFFKSEIGAIFFKSEIGAIFFKFEIGANSSNNKAFKMAPFCQITRFDNGAIFSNNKI